MPDLHLSDLVRRAAQLNGRRPASRFGDRHATWAEHAARIDARAAGLVLLGVRAGDRVAILAHNSDHMIETLFAIPRLGAIATPLNTRLSTIEIATQARDADARVLVHDSAHADVAASLLAEGAVAHLGELERLGDGGVFAGAPRSGSEPAMLLYTGGTTGHPKGVVHSSRSLVMNAYQSADLLGATDDLRFIHVAPLFHVGAISLAVAVAAQGGCHLPIGSFDPVGVVDIVETCGATHLTLVPTMISRMLHAPTFDAARLSTLRRVIYGASPIPETLLTRAITALPWVSFAQSYGQTEAITMTVLSPDRHVLHGQRAGKLRSAGMPAVGVEVFVRGPDGEEAPRGALGEIEARSESVMLGYWRQPELSAVTLHDGWIKTGDIGYMDEDGFVFVVDRAKDMIISGGENIYSIEVENALARHPSVLECAVIGLPDSDLGERVHAVVRFRQGMDASEAELSEHLRSLIARYKRPRSFTITEASFPLSAAGKVLKRVLRDQLAAGQS